MLGDHVLHDGLQLNIWDDDDDFFFCFSFVYWRVFLYDLERLLSAFC